MKKKEVAAVAEGQVENMMYFQYGYTATPLLEIFQLSHFVTCF
jgi:hypothetical protein